MTAFSKLQGACQTVEQRFMTSPPIERLTRGDLTLAHYASYLRETYFYTREDPQIQALCTAWFRGSDRESRPARPSGAVARLARPLARFVRAQAGRAWQAVRADLESRLQGLPLFITHGKLDWMFPVQTARQTQSALSAAGARVTYREIDDLSHTYPREINAELLRWLNGE